MLRCVSPYRRTDGIRFEVGTVVDDPPLEAHLLKDSPGSFERYEPPPPVTAPADKMARPRLRKGV